MVRYQVLLCLNTYDTDAIAINKLCKLNFRYFTMYLVKYSNIYNMVKVSSRVRFLKSINMVYKIL